MKSAEHRQPDDLASAVGRRRSAGRNEAPDPLVGALLEVPNVFDQHRVQVTLTEHDDVIDALAAKAL